MAATIEIVLSQPENRKRKLELVLDAFEHSLAERWLNALWELVELRLLLKKDFGIFGLPDSPEGIPFWLRRLKRYVKEINAYSRPEGIWKKGYQISCDYSAGEIFRGGRYFPEPMWAVHHDFELLHGQLWSMSPYFLEANAWIKYCIFQINDMVHQVEWLGRSLANQKKDPASVAPFTMFTFPSILHPFEKGDERFFEIDGGGLGGVYLKYAQAGKNHWEAFIEGDTEIFKSNVSGLRHYTGQFLIEWGGGMAPGFLAARKVEFQSWLRANGWDPADPRLALGRAKVGQLRTEIFGSRSIPDIHRLLARYRNVERITVRRGAKSVSCDYPIHYTDRKFEHVQAYRFLTDAITATSVSARRGVHWQARPGYEAPEAVHLQHAGAF